MIGLIASALTMPALTVAAADAPAPVVRTTAQPAERQIQANYAAAAEAASRTGEPQVVDDLTTERSQVSAQPDGTFKLTASVQPTRVKDGGQWRRVDTTLTRNADGSISPTSTTVDLTFSGGGAAPLLTIANDADQSVSFSWPTDLPEPTLSGNVATYSEVLPGVDIQLVALADSYREVIVVKNQQAARNPAISKIELKASTTGGLTLGENEQGGISAVDGKGEAAFSGPAPYMWDTETGSRGSTSAESTGTGKVSEVGLTMSGGSSGIATLTPPKGSLLGPSVDYPLYIDPVLSGGAADSHPDSNRLTVHEGGWDYFNDPTEPLRVGRCDWAFCNDGNQIRSRSYFSFNIGDIRKIANTDPALSRPAAKIYEAKVTVDQEHSASNCDTPQPTQLWTAGSFDGSDNWPGPRGVHLQTVSSAASHDCTRGYLTYANSSVIDRVSEVAEAGHTTIRFNLSAADEDNRLQWKKLSNNPELEVIYNIKPKNPWDLSIEDTFGCSGTKYLRSQMPTIWATTGRHTRSEFDDSTGLGLQFEVRRASDGVAVRNNPTIIWTSNGTPKSWNTGSANSSSPALLPPGTYRMAVRAVSQVGSDQTRRVWSDWTISDPHVIDATAPAIPSGIQSFDYPVSASSASAWGSPEAAAGTIKVEGSTDTTGFTYSIDTSGGQLNPPDQACTFGPSPNKFTGYVPADSAGDAVIPISDWLDSGPHTLYIKSFDAARNVSLQSEGYRFYVSPELAAPYPSKAEAWTPVQAEGQDFPVVLSSNSAAYGGDFRQIIATRGTAEAPTKFTFKIHAPVDAYYALGIGTLAASHFGQVTFELNGVPIMAENAELKADLYSSTPRAKYFELGGAKLSLGYHEVTLKVVGKHLNSDNYCYGSPYNVCDNGRTIGVDYFSVIPINNVTFADLTAAMNNDGSAPEGTRGNLGPSTGFGAMPQAELASTGFGPGATPSVNGVTFKMPSYRTPPTEDESGAVDYDNVIAAGQTIPMPMVNGAYPAGNYVNFLVNTSCGVMPGNVGRIALGINHTGGDTEPILIRNRALPSVPSWLGYSDLPTPTPPGATVTRALELPFYTVSGDRRTTSKPYLYHLKVPVHPGDETRPIESITLPSLGTKFTHECDSAALHVYAIAVSN